LQVLVLVLICARKSSSHGDEVLLHNHSQRAARYFAILLGGCKRIFYFVMLILWKCDFYATLIVSHLDLKIMQQ